MVRESLKDKEENVTHLDRLFDAMRRTRIFRWIDIGQEHGIDERWFAQSRLADYHQRKFEALFDGPPIHLVGKTGHGKEMDIGCYLIANFSKKKREEEKKKEEKPYLAKPT